MIRCRICKFRLRRRNSRDFFRLRGDGWSFGDFETSDILYGRRNPIIIYIKLPRVLEKPYFRNYIRELTIVYILTSIAPSFCAGKVQRAHRLSNTFSFPLHRYKNNHFHSRVSFTAVTPCGKYILIMTDENRPSMIFVPIILQRYAKEHAKVKRKNWYRSSI